MLLTADESLDRLAALVENLLDMSRLQAGALALAVQPLDVADAVPAAVDTVGPAAGTVVLRIPDELPDVLADPALLERAVANLVANAVRYSPPDRPPAVTASEHEGRVEIRVVDTGPGVPTEQWDHIFLPFQRLGDTDNTTGVGLGLALARGLVEAMGGTLVPEVTPGGGLTMTISLPAGSRVGPRHTRSNRPTRMTWRRGGNLLPGSRRHGSEQMADKHQQAEDMRDDVPSTIARSDDKAVRTYKETLESAEETYGDGERAHRTAFAALKHTHEKVGDHWEPKDHKGPSDPQAAKGGDAARKGANETAGGVDANASKQHLLEVAKRVGVPGRSRMTKDELVDAIQKANNRATAKARANEKK